MLDAHTSESSRCTPRCMDEGAELSWMRQPHYYMSLYPYTYAAGLTASTAAAKRIREQGQPAVDQWLEALF